MVYNISGHFEVVRALIQDPRVDVTVKENFALRAACEFGHLEIVEELLQYKHVDPSAMDNFALEVACANGYLRIVEMVHHDVPIRVTERNSAEFRSVTRMGTPCDFFLSYLRMNV